MSVICESCESLDNSASQLMIPVIYFDKMRICSANEKGYIIRSKLKTESEFLQFLIAWTKESHVTWRHLKSDPENMSAGRKNEFWRQYRCQSSNLRISKTAENPSKKHTDCKAMLTVTIRRISKRCRFKDPHLPEYPMIIKANLNHNHELVCAKFLKFKDVSKDVALKFTNYFHRGVSPKNALKKHKFNLRATYGDNYSTMAIDRSQCPDLQWCYRLYNSIKNGKHNCKNLEQQLASRFNRDCIKYSKYGEDAIIAVCTPLMKKVHALWPNSGELMFLDSFQFLDCPQYKIFVMFTQRTAGDLPLGVIILTSEKQEIITEGFKNFMHIIGKDAFFGRGHLGPEIIITSDSQAEQNALADCFQHKPTIMICIFHLLQATWRFIWKAESNIEMVDRLQIFDSLKNIVYSNNEIELQQNYDIAITSDVFSKYTNVLDYFREMWQRKHLWALCYGEEYKTKDMQHFYVESVMRVLKDKILLKKKEYGIIHILDVIFFKLENYYTSKLNDIAANKSTKRIEKKFKHKELFVLLTENVDIYKVRDLKTDSSFTVDIGLGLCSCYAGNCGGHCEHQSVVIEKCQLNSYNFFPDINNDQQSLLKKIVCSFSSQEVKDTSCRLQKDCTNYTEIPDLTNDLTNSQAGPESLELKLDHTTTVYQSNEEEIRNVENGLQSFCQYVETQGKDDELLSALTSFNESVKRCKSDNASEMCGETDSTNSNKLINVQSAISVRRKRVECSNDQVNSYTKMRKGEEDHTYGKSSNCSGI